MKDEKMLEVLRKLELNYDENLIVKSIYDLENDIRLKECKTPTEKNHLELLKTI